MQGIGLTLNRLTWSCGPHDVGVRLSGHTHGAHFVQRSCTRCKPCKADRLELPVQGFKTTLPFLLHYVARPWTDSARDRGLFSLGLLRAVQCDFTQTPAASVYTYRKTALVAAAKKGGLPRRRNKHRISIGHTQPAVNVRSRNRRDSREIMHLGAGTRDTVSLKRIVG